MYITTMTKKIAKKTKRQTPVSRTQLARIIYRTMKIEEPSVTLGMANKAARSVRLPK
jgi:hypothetical protein